jgi:F-type H+-transporting ATPase subunit b
MQAVLTTFGIDWRLLLINAVNFGLLMLGLWYFLYAPVMKMLEERRQKVAKGVEDARAAQARLKEIEASREGTMAAAGKQADLLVEEARAAAKAKEREILAQGEKRAQARLAEAQAQAQELKEKALEESKREVAKLIVLGIEKAR